MVMSLHARASEPPASMPRVTSSLFGKLYGRTGKGEQACEHLTTATTMYREMGMRFYLEQAETATREPRD